jgi:8-oxo-dGTP pyrophosphatase MutT (NUDIX family)
MKHFPKEIEMLMKNLVRKGQISFPKTGKEKNAVMFVLVWFPQHNCFRVLSVMEANGTWGLPGGAIDAGEDAFHAATREMREETGHHLDRRFMHKEIKFTFRGTTRIYMWVYDNPAAHDVKKRAPTREIQGCEFVRLSEFMRAASVDQNTEDAKIKCGPFIGKMRNCFRNVLAP